MALPLSQARNMISNGRLIAAADTAGEKMGVTDNEVLIGSCCSLSGNLAERGHQLAIGAQSYLQSINEQGGVNGRKIKLSQCDDKYDPEAAIGCFNTCLKDKIFAGAFFVGSPPISKYVRMGDANHIPLLGFCTGTPVIYEQHGSDCHHFILRRGYADEVDKQIKELYKNRGIRKFAIVYQSDAFGAAVRESALKALKGYGVQPVVEASYSRRTQDIEDAYKLLRQNHPEVVILGATSDAFKGLVKRKNDDKWNAVFVGLSVDDDYVGELGAAADGMILTQVVPLMDDHSLPAVKLFEKLHAKYEPGAQVAATAFEAFLNAEVLAEALKRSGHDLTRSGFVKALESMHGFDIGAGSEFKVSFSPSDHVGWPTGSVFLTIVKDGKPVVIHEADWKAALKSIKSGT
jgi:ABC-type branched-subunit amino acid transport system substrate-binding protein